MQKPLGEEAQSLELALMPLGEEAQSWNKFSASWRGGQTGYRMFVFGACCGGWRWEMRDAAIVLALARAAPRAPSAMSWREQDIGRWVEASMVDELAELHRRASSFGGRTLRFLGLSSLI